MEAKEEHRKLELWNAIKTNGDMLLVERKCKIIVSVLNKKKSAYLKVKYLTCDFIIKHTNSSDF